MSEVPLLGGRVTPGVVRVGETVRRPLGPNSGFVHMLLDHLETSGFDGAPRFFGLDGEGREILSYIPGDVPPDLQADHPDWRLRSAASLIRSFHDATAGSRLAGREEVVCHNDLSPCNFVLRGGKPVGLIDFDAAAPGPRVRDLGYALFLWLNLGTDGPDLAEQVRRWSVFLDTYGLEDRSHVVEALMERQREVIEQLGEPWWAEQLAWVERHRVQLEAGL